MKIVVKFCFITIFALFLLGCSGPLFAVPTATTTPTHTPTTTQSSTPTLTATPAKTLTVTPTPLVKLGEEHVLSEGGFSLRVPIGYSSQVENRQIFLASLDGALIISFASVESTSSEEEIVEEYLDAVARRSDGEFTKTPSDPMSVDGLDGKTFDLTGSLAGFPLQGKTFIVPIRESRFLYALAIAKVSEDGNAWEDQGLKVFETIVDSIEIFEPESSATCPIATDTTYGYTKENAIRIGDGGKLFGGPARERAYLDNLRGPHAGPISYKRTGSLNFEETILDEYVITGLGKPVILYLDIYKFEELKAPVGFTCASSFNLPP